MKKLLTLSALALVLGGVAAQAQETAPRNHPTPRQTLSEMRQDGRDQRQADRRTILYSSEDVQGALDGQARGAYAEYLNARYLFGNPEDSSQD